MNDIGGKFNVTVDKAGEGSVLAVQQLSAIECLRLDLAELKNAAENLLELIDRIK